MEIYTRSIGKTIRIYGEVIKGDISSEYAFFLYTCSAFIGVSS